MKTIIFIAALCFVEAYGGVLNEEQMNEMMQFKKECGNETGTDPAVLEVMKQKEQYTHEEKLDCFSACMLKKYGYMQADGTIDSDLMKMKTATMNVDTEKVNKVIDDCKDQSGKDACETGGNWMKCAIEKKYFKLLA